MVKLCEKGTHCWEENVSANICKKYVGKKIIWNSWEKKKKNPKSRPLKEKWFSVPRRINNWHAAASEAATKQMDGYGYSLSYIY